MSFGRPIAALALALAVAATVSAALWARADTSPTSRKTAAARCREVVVAVGDIVNSVAVADRTGRLAAAQRPSRVLVLGDNQYQRGSLAEYRTGYQRTAWGRLKRITRPVPGNHEYFTPGAAGYFAYFGHPPPYYAFDLGCGWRGYALNSQIGLAAQVAWLRRDLAAHRRAAVVAYWHQPRWSSGAVHGSTPAMQPFWSALAGRRGVVLNGHEHNYERFAPIGGLRQFVVGTGGWSTYGFGRPLAISQRRIARTPGVLRLTLRPRARYDWAFLAVTGVTADRGP